MNPRNLTDEQLEAALERATTDLEQAALSQPNSDWHEACFAAVMTLGSERARRKQH